MRFFGSMFQPCQQQNSEESDHFRRQERQPDTVQPKQARQCDSAGDDSDGPAQQRTGSRCRLPNGPLRAQPKAGYIFSLVLCDVGHTLVAGDMQVSRKAHGITP